MVPMEDYKGALKYLELLEIVTLRRFTDADLFADIFYSGVPFVYMENIYCWSIPLSSSFFLSYRN